MQNYSIYVELQIFSKRKFCHRIDVLIAKYLLLKDLTSLPTLSANMNLVQGLCSASTKPL